MKVSYWSCVFVTALDWAMVDERLKSRVHDLTERLNGMDDPSIEARVLRAVFARGVSLGTGDDRPVVMIAGSAAVDGMRAIHAYYRDPNNAHWRECPVSRCAMTSAHGRTVGCVHGSVAFIRQVHAIAEAASVVEPGPRMPKGWAGDSILMPREAPPRRSKDPLTIADAVCQLDFGATCSALMEVKSQLEDSRAPQGEVAR